MAASLYLINSQSDMRQLLGQADRLLAHNATAGQTNRVY